MALLKKYNEEDFRNKVRSSNHAIHEKYDDLPKNENYDSVIESNVKSFSTLEQHINTRIGVAQAGNVEINGEGLIDYNASFDVGDARNAFAIQQSGLSDGFPVDHPKDLIKFKINVIDSLDPFNSDLIIFRAFLDDFSDDYTAGYNNFKYNGRAEKFYTYTEFDRSISFNFKIAAQTRSEMKPIYQKLNYLVAQTAPEYSKGSSRMRAKFSRLTVGDWCNELPGFFEKVSLKWNKSYPWEVVLDPNNKDSDMNQLPHILDVSCGFRPIHDFAPENRKDAPFILPERGVLTSQQWHRDA
jgi:hypothetical protein